MKKIAIGVLSIVFALTLLVPSGAQAQSSNVDDLLTRVQELLDMISDLQNQLDKLRSEQAELHNELRDEIRDGLHQGMTDEDIEKIQELLASDSAIYPEGLVTGYFGPLTKRALERFQQRFELRVTGEIDEDTRLHLEELLQEKFGDNIPPGLLRAPGIQEKVRIRLKDGCDNARRGTAFFCNKIRIKVDDNDDEDDDDDELEIEVEFEGGVAKVKVNYPDDSETEEEEFEFDTTDEDEVIDMLVEETNLTEEEIRDVIKFEESDEDDEDDDDSDDNDDS